jgi:type I restriction enzyme R subunit
MSNFAFLQPEFPSQYDAAVKAEAAAHSDPRSACFYARRALELAMHWLFKHDASLRLPYQDNLSALVHEPTFKQAAGDAIFSKARVIITLGNRAVQSHRAIPESDAIVAVRELFHVFYWFARTYGRRDRPAPTLAFDPTALPSASVGQKTAEQLATLEASLRARDEKLDKVLADKGALDAELVRLRQEVAKAKQAAASQPDTHDYSEAQTRDYFIDLLLKEAGWPLDQPRDREFEVDGMPNNEGKGYVDYVLWGDDGRPLGLVEAKRTRRDPRVGQQQAKLYADCLERRFGQRPLIFYSNGYETWLWDDVNHPPRPVQGFYKKSELELLVQRRHSRKALAEAVIDTAIAERHYQFRAIRRIGEAFERDRERKALVVMATGAGKTRTVIALCDLLMRCNWVKRVLFLADRIALVNQAVGAFKRHLPDASPVNLVTERDAEGRVFVSTYPTMMGLIDETRNGQRRFGPGHFDLVVIDEAHRSVFQKYRAIFDYFDAMLVGLTATPKDEIDRNTYRLFDLESGVPTDAYSLDEAIRDGFLVPPEAISVPLKFQREGIRYDDLTEDEKDEWDALEWDDDGNVPRQVDPAAVNAWLFNKDTVDKVLAHLMTRGVKVAGGDRLGKTIVFAKNQAHADFIAERFDANYPHLQGQFARVITFKTEYAQSLIDAFSNKGKEPHIAISVDMLDTGIDVPEVVNLVFFKLVHSKTKFWQMVGRGTRLCPNLFGPGQDKRFFYLLDYCQNLEYFGQDPPLTDGSVVESLAKRLFDARLGLIGALDERLDADDKATSGEPRITVEAYADPQTNAEVRASTANALWREVMAMNVDNFVVRAHRRAIEKYRAPEAWSSLDKDAVAQLTDEVAGLPTELPGEDEEAKRFDLIVLGLQLARLGAGPGFERLRDRVREIATALAEKSAIPMVREQMVLIEEVQGDAWWQDVTVPMLERLGRRLRNLVQFIDKGQRKIVYTDFEDAIGDGEQVDLPGFVAGTDYERFRAKAQAFLRQHLDHMTIAKLRMNRPLTRADLSELERMLLKSGNAEDVERAKEESHGLGFFVRSLVGLDREAAKAALGEFLNDKTLAANQIEFVNLIVDHLTERGVLLPEALYESPFTDVASTGPDAIFPFDRVERLMAALDGVAATAKVA